MKMGKDVREPPSVNVLREVFCGQRMDAIRNIGFDRGVSSDP